MTLSTLSFFLQAPSLQQGAAGRLTRLTLCLLIFTGSLPQRAQAQDDSRYAAAFLDIPLGVRALSLGGQYSPTDNTDGSAFYWNPAAVSLTQDKLISTMYSNQFGKLGDPLSSYLHIGYTMGLGKGVGVSFNYIRNSISNIPYTTDPSPNGGTGLTKEQIDNLFLGLNNTGVNFSNADNALYISIAKNLATNIGFGWQFFSVPVEIPIGVSFKYISQGFSGTEAVRYGGTGIGIDAGAMLKFKVGDFVGSSTYGELAFGATVKDLFNTPIAWNTPLKVKNSIERATLLSFSYQQPLNFLASTLTGLYTRNFKYDGITSLGLEYRFRDIIALRLGSYNRELTFGAGISAFRALYIDYAYQYSELGSPHRIGLTLNLSRLLP